MTDGWSFDDDRQQQVATATRPSRILAYAQAAQTLAALGVPISGYFGSQHHADSGATPVAGLDAPYAGSGDTVDTDLIAELRPDLVVSVTYGGEVYGVSEAAIAGVAPLALIGIAGDRTLQSVIQRFHELAVALGADVGDPADALTSALEQLPTGKQVIALSGGTDADAYVANPAYWPSLRLLRDAGVPFAPTTATGGWEVVKWPDLPSADILLYDQRPNSLGPDRLAHIPAWSEITGEVLPWNPEPPLTYEAAAAFVRAIG
jgi:iron complex transport system substrate-binding protein